MRFGIRDLLWVTVLVSLHLVLMKLCYPDWGTAFATDLRLAVWAVGGYVVLLLVFDQESRNAGEQILAGQLQEEVAWPWELFLLLHADLILASFSICQPLPVGTLRYVAAVVIASRVRRASIVTVHAQGIIFVGRLRRWTELRSRLENREGSYWLVIELTLTDELQILRLPAPTEAIDRLREVRARAILASPSTVQPRATEWTDRQVSE